MSAPSSPEEGVSAIIIDLHRGGGGRERGKERGRERGRGRRRGRVLSCLTLRGMCLGGEAGRIWARLTSI